MTTPQALTIRYASANDLAAHLAEQPGALLIRLPDLAGFDPNDTLSLDVHLPDAQVNVTAEFLQILDGLGLVVRLVTPEPLLALVADVTPSSPATPPEIRLGLTSEDADGGTGASSPTEASEEEDSATRNSATHGRPPPRPGTTPVSWPIERLQAEWLSLTTPEKIRVARLGKRPARAMIMRMQDKILHAFLLRNPKMGIDEIATMAGMVQLDPTLLRQIAMTQEWIRHTGVARNLVAHPKLPIPLIKKIMPHLSVDELRRLTRSGRVRASVKRLLMKRVERGR